MKNRIPASLICSTLSLSAAAFAAEPAWLPCRLEPAEKQLECYQNATTQYLSAPLAKDLNAAPQTKGEQPTTHLPIAAAAVPAVLPTWKLDRLWPLPDEVPNSGPLANTFQAYRQNYLLLDATYSPADQPGSPNPLNQSTTSRSYQSSELKFQISLKAPLPVTWPWGDTAWFTYTQQSRWQAFNGKDSRPFRENDYEPELIYLSHRFGNDVVKLGPFTPRFLNLSYVHQSNGQTLPRSRSWNRLTAQLGSEYRFQSSEEDVEDRRLAVLIRPWWRVRESPNDDDNPDITKYLGHGDIEIDYWRGRSLYAVLLRSRAVQFDWSFPLIDDINSLSLHLQYFDGYGESLIDYNHKLHSFGIGFSLPY